MTILPGTRGNLNPTTGMSAEDEVRSRRGTGCRDDESEPSSYEGSALVKGENNNNKFVEQSMAAELSR